MARWWLNSGMELIVARIGRAHGLRGEVTLNVRTDSPESRFVRGQEFRTEPNCGTLTVESARANQGSWIVKFLEVPDRTAAEALRNTDLLVDEADSIEEDAWYSHELVGMRAELQDGTEVGSIIGIEHGVAQDLLVLRELDGAETRIPFVHAIVPEVDRANGVVVLTPPGGLLARDAENLVISTDETAGLEASHLETAELERDKIVSDIKPTEPNPELEAELELDRVAEKLVQAAAEPAPPIEERYPGEIHGTLPAEDVNSHHHTGLPN